MLLDKREKISSCRRCWQKRNKGARGTNMSVNFLKTIYTVHRRVGLFLVHHSSAFNLIICSNQDMFGTWQQASHHKYDVQYSSRKNISLPFYRIAKLESNNFNNYCLKIKLSQRKEFSALKHNGSTRKTLLTVHVCASMQKATIRSCVPFL